MTTENTIVTERRLKRLNELNNSLCEELGKPTATEESIEILVQSIKTLEKEKREAAEIKKLNAVNRKHEERKNFLIELLALEFPKDEDIQNNDGSFHSTKLKKYPSLSEFMEKYKYARFTTDKGIYTECKEGRHTYRILRSHYNSGEPNSYTKFESLEEACSYNWIQFKQMTYKKFQALQKSILKESAKMQKAIAIHNEKINSLNAYFLENEQLIQPIKSDFVKAYYQSIK